MSWISPIWHLAGSEERLRHLWVIERRSARVIATMLSEEFGIRVTDRSVSSKVERLGLQRRIGAAVAERSVGVSLAGGYLYSGGQLVRTAEQRGVA